MTQEVTTLVLGVDSSGVRRAGTDLDSLASKGKRAETSTASFAASLQSLNAIVKVGAIALLAKEALQTADAFQNMSARVALVTRNARELADVQAALFTASQSTRVGLEETAGLYTALARSTQTLGASQSEVIKVTESINKALVISGTSAASAQAALVQLGQGFASGVLRGEELNSVLEQAPRLAQAIADGLGVPIGRLRQLGSDGEITAEKLFRALQNSGASLSAEFDRMPVTVGGATTRVGNSITQLIGTVDKLTSTSATVAGWASQFTVALDGVSGRVSRSGGVVAGYLDALSEDYARARLQATREEIDRMGDAAARAQRVLATQPDSIYAKDTLRQFSELKAAAVDYEATIKRIQGIDMAAKATSSGGGRARDVSERTLASVSAQLAKEERAYTARKDFLKEYATAEEKFTAELKKQKEAQGDLFTAADEKRLRAKMLPKKGPALDYVKGDVGEVQRELNSLVSVYADAEKLLEANRTAGLISERAYYDEKLILLELNTAAQVSALKAENDAIEARARKGQKGLDDDRKVADNLAQITILQRQAGTSAQIMGIEQKSAADKARASYDLATAAARDYLETVSRQNQRQLAAVGLGDKAKSRVSERNSIEDKYQAQLDDATGERRRNQITDEQLQERLSLIRATQAEELAMWEKHNVALDAASGNWINGATAAMQNYADMAADVSTQVRDAFQGGFKGMEDALVQFAMTGKGNFKELANSIIADILRIQMRAALSGLMNQLMGAAMGSYGNAGYGDYTNEALVSAGPRAIGGPVSANSLYRVNERGPGELLEVGSKQYLMTGSQGGSVSPTGAGGAAPVTNISVAAGPTRNEVLSAIQIAVAASEARQTARLRKAGISS